MSDAPFHLLFARTAFGEADNELFYFPFRQEIIDIPGSLVSVFSEYGILGQDNTAVKADRNTDPFESYIYTG
jgi:hypothetical protein